MKCVPEFLLIKKKNKVYFVLNSKLSTAECIFVTWVKKKSIKIIKSCCSKQI